MAERIGRQTLRLTETVHVGAYAAAGGKKEGEGPLGGGFDLISEDAWFGQDSWEKAESSMLRECLNLCLGKWDRPPSPIWGSTGPARRWPRGWRWRRCW